MVAGRAHLAEGVGGAARHHGVDGVEACADGAQRGFPRAGRDDGVAVELLQVIDVLDGCADLLEVAGRMRARDVLLHVLAQRCLLAHQVAEDIVAKHLVDRPHAVGPLGVA